MELTQEYFEQALDTRFANLEAKIVTKTDFENGLNHLVSVIDTTVAQPMERHFAEYKEQLDVSKKVAQLEHDMQKIKDALNLTDTTVAVH